MADTTDEDIIGLEDKEEQFDSFDKEFGTGRETVTAKSSSCDSNSIPEEMQQKTLSSTSSEAVHPDGEYLKQHLGLPLSLALADIAMKSPADPINYLAHWLMRWRWNQEYRQIQQQRSKELEAEEEKLRQQLAWTRILEERHPGEDVFYVAEVRSPSTGETTKEAEQSLLLQEALLQAPEDEGLETQISDDKDG